jgi:hypothetical protein
MAQSLAHKFGQIIGELLEMALEPRLQKFAKKRALYLDKKGTRAACSGKKVTWFDDKGNQHDLDFVLERNGSVKKIGVPAAFIESAWRRYTRHSRNKAQEIQGAIQPLANKYKIHSPFIGVVLAGEFTESSLVQLASQGFGVLYFPYQTIVQAFAKFGIDAHFDDKTPELDFLIKIDAWYALSKKKDLAKTLLSLNKSKADEFFDLLDIHISRYIQSILVLPLHGEEQEINNIQDAIYYLSAYGETKSTMSLYKIEIIIKYNNGDKIEASFRDKNTALSFLKTYL